MKVKRFLKGLMLGMLPFGFYLITMNLVSFIAQLLIAFSMTIRDPYVSKEAILAAINEWSMLILVIADILILSGFWFFFKVIKESSLKDYCTITRLPSKILIFTYALGFSLNSLTETVLKVLPIPESWEVDHAKNTDFKGPVLIIILAVWVMAPILEEILFRGLMYRTIKNYSSVVIASVISSVVFGVIHMNILQAIYAGVLGMILVFSYETSKSLQGSIAMHFGFNSAGLITVITGFGKLPEIVKFVISLILTIGLMFALFRHKKSSDAFEGMSL